MHITTSNYKTRSFEQGQPVVAMGRDSIIVSESGIYGTAEMIRVMDVKSGRTWSMQVWRIA